MKKFVALILLLALPLVALAVTPAGPVGGLVAKVEWLLAQFGDGSAEGAGRVPPLGTIISSALPYELMPESFRKVWFPADGRPVEETAFGRLLAAKDGAAAAYPHLFSPDGKPKAPDLRGVFLRGLNVFDTAQANPADLTKAGLASFLWTVNEGPIPFV